MWWFGCPANLEAQEKRESVVPLCEGGTRGDFLRGLRRRHVEGGVFMVMVTLRGFWEGDWCVLAVGLVWERDSWTFLEGICCSFQAIPVLVL